MAFGPAIVILVCFNAAVNGQFLNFTSDTYGEAAGINNAPTSNIRAGTCGQSFVTMARKRIVGGYEAKAHSIPWIVSLRQWSRYHFCGGTLIRTSQSDQSDIVITAAHCVSDSSNFDVVAGAHSTSNAANGQQSVRASSVVRHPNYNGVANDIAVVKLSRPITFSNTIQPACLPSRGEKVSDGSQGIVAGWGRLKDGGSTPDTLQQVTIPIVGYQKCNQSYGSRLNADAMICGGFDRGGKDSCQGDSGGPYLFRGSNGYTLQGVVSWGYGCAQPNAPGVYTRVSTYVDWIQQQVRSLSRA